MDLSELSDVTDEAPDESESIAIFVCYRRDDSQHAAGRIYDRLVQRFGERQVFMDVDTIPLGVDFGEFIDEQVGRCDAFIAVIGKHWLVKDGNGRRRIDDPGDFVRLEIATALRRRIRLIPTLVDGASMPSREELPSEIRTLTMRNGLQVRHERFNADVSRLLDELGRIPHDAPKRRSTAPSHPPGELAPDPNKFTPTPTRVMRIGESPKPPLVRPIGVRATSKPPSVRPMETDATPKPPLARPIGADTTPVPTRATPMETEPPPEMAPPMDRTEAPTPVILPPNDDRTTPASTLAAPTEGSLAPVTASAPFATAEPPLAPLRETAPPVAIASPMVAEQPKAPKDNLPAPAAIAPTKPAPQSAARVEVPVAKEPAPKTALPQSTAALPATPPLARHPTRVLVDAEPPDTRSSSISRWTKEWPAIAAGLSVSCVVVTLLWIGGDKSRSSASEVKQGTAFVAASDDGRSALPAAGEASAAPALASTDVAATPQTRPFDRPESGTMVRISAGSFLMGSDDGDKDEKPAHNVDLPSFEMDQTEVTVKAYRACVTAGECPERTTVNGDWFEKNGGVDKWSHTCNLGKAARDDHPMNCVDWSDAEKFCKWAVKRLPTEEEWEYAARGSENRKYPWGGDALSAQRLNACGPECIAWLNQYIGKQPNSRQAQPDKWPNTAPAGSFSLGNSPNALQDMAGNVWEWAASWYCPYRESGCANSTRVYRGGSWTDDNSAHFRAAIRNEDDPTFRASNLGFRCAR